MNVADYFHIDEGYDSFQPVGNVSLEEGAAACVEAIRVAGGQGIPRLLINLTGLTGLGPISTLDRFWLAKQWASAAKPGLKLAVVANPDMIDRQHIGVTVARNRGLRAKVFDHRGRSAGLAVVIPTEIDGEGAGGSDPRGTSRQPPAPNGAFAARESHNGLQRLV